MLPDYYDNLTTPLVSSRPLGTDTSSFPDRSINPELQVGTVDYTVGEDYYAQPPSRRKPQPMHILFVVDVSEGMVRSDALQAIASSLRNALYTDHEDGKEKHPGDSNPFRFPSGVKVGFMTYSKTLHFYRFEVSSAPTSLICLKLRRRIEFLSAPDVTSRVDDSF